MEGCDVFFSYYIECQGESCRNAGISDGVQGQLPYLARHPGTAADPVQFAAAVGITNCPGAPRLKFFTGRPNATAPPEGLIPAPSDSVTKILARFADAGNLTPADTIALLSSYSIANADHVDPTIQAVPFDST
ncbi:class II peroxidase, partial [Sphaerobolus stellatus SS14]